MCGRCKKSGKNKTGEIKKILVPIDESRRSKNALDAAVYMGKYLGASITVIQTSPNVPFKNVKALAKFKSQMKEQAKQALSAAKYYCATKNFSVTTKMTSGDPAIAILDTAHKEKYDLIIMGSSGKGVTKEIILGSVSNFVLHKSKVPVLTVKESSKRLSVKR